MINTAPGPPEALVLDADSISLTDTDGAGAVSCALSVRVASVAAAPAAGFTRRVSGPALAVTGRGAASKEQVAHMVTRLLRLSDPPRPVDATDALALAICSVWRGGASRRIDAAIAALSGEGSR